MHVIRRLDTAVFPACCALALGVAPAFAASHTVTFRRLNGTVLRTGEVAHGADATALVPEAPSESGFSFSSWDHAEQLAHVTNDVTCWALYEATAAKSPSISIASQSIADRDIPYSLDEYFRIYDNLAWSDEFSGSSLDAGAPTWWGGSSGRTWTYNTAHINNELQQYTTGGNTTVSDGTLKITARRESNGGRMFTSAAIKSQGMVAFKHGRCEIRARLTKQKGTWPAFWLMGSTGNWPNCGELDVFEQINGSKWIGGNLHLADGHGATISNSGLAATEDGTHWGDAFHRIGVIMNDYECVWYVDDHIFKRMDVRSSRYSTVHDYSWYILLNLAFGGNWPGQTDPDDASIADFQSEDYEIDYCRVFTNTKAGNTVERAPEPEGAALSGPVRATVWRGWQMKWGKPGAYRSGLDRSEADFFKAAMTEYFTRDNADVVTFLTRPAENTGANDLTMPFDVPGYTTLSLSPEAGCNYNEYDADRRERLLGTVLFNRNRFSQTDSGIGTLPISNDANFTNACAVLAELVERGTGAKVKVVSVNGLSTNGVENAGDTVAQGFSALMSKLDVMKDDKVILLLQGEIWSVWNYLDNRVKTELKPSYSRLGQFTSFWPAYQSAWVTTSYAASAENPAPLSVPKANGQASGVHTNQAYCATVDFVFPPPDPGLSFGAVGTAPGFAWTNATATVTVFAADEFAVPAGAKVRLTVSDASGAVVGTVDRDWGGAGNYAFDTAGAIGGAAFADGFDYTFTFSVVDAGGSALAEDTAATSLCLGAKAPWFSADAATGAVAGGAWSATPAIRNGAYLVGSNTSFTATSGREGYARVEFALPGNSTVSASNLSDMLAFAAQNGERAGLVAVQGDDGGIVWHGLVQENGAPAWKALEGGTGTSDSVQAAFELDTAGTTPRVSYFVWNAGAAPPSFVRLHDANGAEWFPAPGTGVTLAGHLDFWGDGTVRRFVGQMLDKAVAEADGVRYTSLAEAIAAGDITLLTNAEWPADAPVGATAVTRDGHTLLRGGVAVEGDTVVVDSGPCVLAGEGTLRVTFGKLASVGVATAGRTPAQIAADLAADGANGIPRWQSLVLGLDADDPASRPYADIAVDGDTVVVSEGGVTVDEEVGATVTYQVVEVPDLANPTAVTPVGEPAAPGEPVPLPMGMAASRFFRIKVLITTP